MNVYSKTDSVVSRLAVWLRVSTFHLFGKKKLICREGVKLNPIFILTGGRVVGGRKFTARKCLFDASNGLNTYKNFIVLWLFMMVSNVFGLEISRVINHIPVCSVEVPYEHCPYYFDYKGFVDVTKTDMNSNCGQHWTSPDTFTYKRLQICVHEVPTCSSESLPIFYQGACLNQCPDSLVVSEVPLRSGIPAKTCAPVFRAVLPQENTPPSCNLAPGTVGNPITLATGEKIQSEKLMFEGVPVNYVFESAKTGSTAQWQQKPDEIRLDKTIAISDQSRYFHSEESACQEGLAELKTRNPGLQDLTAEYVCSTCFLKKDGQVVSALGIGTKTKIDRLVQYKRQDGSLTNYFLSCAGQFQPTLGSSIPQSLIRDGNDWQLISSNGKKTFNRDGKIAAVHSPAGNLEYSYTYNRQGDLATVKNGYNQQFTYNYNNGQLSSIQAPNGKILQFNYIENMVTKVSHPDQSTRIYHYEDTRFPKYLTGITDERGVRYATWKYDDQGRAISSEHAGGAEKTSLNFNPDGSTTVTNALGKKTTYSFTDILGVRRVSKVTGEPTASCVGAYQSYTYTPQGQVETKTDWNGSVTRFSYDSFGRELTKTQAYGTAEAKAIQTCWHETLNQPSRIIEPTRITLFDYTPTGQFKSQTVKPRPAGAVDCSTAL